MRGKSDNPELSGIIQLNGNTSTLTVISEESNEVPIKVVKPIPEVPRKVYWDASTKGKVGLKERVNLAPVEMDGESEFPMECYKKQNGKFTEIPHLLDGFRMLNNSEAEDPEEVYSLNISGQELELIIEEDMAMFTNLHTLNASENSIPLAKLGLLPSLKSLKFSCNGLQNLDLDLEGKFKKLEFLDLSYNQVRDSALIVLATLPNLRLLDLTGNHIKNLSKDIHDIENWKMNVIELILPHEVVALVPKEDESGIRSTNVSVMGASIQTHMSSYFGSEGICGPSQGFQYLHTLILEHNPLGASENIEWWCTLARLPALTVLNLNRTQLKSLKPLVPAEFQSFTFKSLIKLEKSAFPADIFPKLEDFYVTDNLISTLEDFVGCIFLPKLKIVQVQGNPVSRILFSTTPLHPTKTKSKTAIAEQILAQFNIKVQDLALIPKPSTIPPNLKSIRKEHSSEKTKTIQFKRSVLKDKPTFRINTIAMRTVPEMVYERAKILERTTKRHHDFTEEDLKLIVQRGYIPSIKELIKEASIGSETKIQKVIEKQAEEAAELDYKPDAKDSTFMTGVHITGQFQDNARLEPEKAKSTDVSLDLDEFPKYELEIPLPTTILGSVVALRQCLKNPGTIWKSLQVKNKTKDKFLFPMPPKKNIPQDEFAELEEVAEYVNSKIKAMEQSLGKLLFTRINHFEKEKSLSYF